MKKLKRMPYHNSKGWILCACITCGRLHYVEPHGTTAYCQGPNCRKWTEHTPVRKDV